MYLGAPKKIKSLISRKTLHLIIQNWKYHVLDGLTISLDTIKTWDVEFVRARVDDRATLVEVAKVANYVVVTNWAFQYSVWKLFVKSLYKLTFLQFGLFQHEFERTSLGLEYKFLYHFVFFYSQFLLSHNCYHIIVPLSICYFQFIMEKNC